MRRALLVLALLAPAPSSFADTIYHFMPDRGQPPVFAQLDFASSLPVSASEPWTLGGGGLDTPFDAVSGITFVLFNNPGLPAASMPAEAEDVTTLVGVAGTGMAPGASGSVSSSTGATIDAGAFSVGLTREPLGGYVAFGPGGSGVIEFQYETPSHDLASFQVAGSWSLGPAVLLPEPASLAMAGLGLAGVGCLALRKGRSFRRSID